ncbi:MAG: pyridoxamine 5'-phosphate oxidase family protein [Dehalococcoidia bacterium]
MTSWHEVLADASEFAGAAQAVFDAHKHKVLATLRRDGSPRVSGNEARFLDGEVYLGMMLDSVKARDLLRDPRLALHSATVDPEMRLGDAKIAGRAIEVPDGDEKTRYLAVQGDPGGDFHLFRIDIDEVVLTRIGTPADHLLIESWHPGRGIERVRRV